MKYDFSFFDILNQVNLLNLIANKEKCVPDEWITEDGTYVTKEFEKYARPLIIGELDPYVVDGLPRHLHID